MAWNQPGNNDPWESGNNKDPRNSGKNNHKPVKKGDDLFQKINIFLGKLLKNNKRRTHHNNKSPSTNISKLMLFIIMLLGGFWVVTGFYTIEEGYQGVILRFGKVQPQLVNAGLHWKPNLVDRILIIDSQGNRDFKTWGVMLTSDENVVNVEMSVVYQVDDPQAFLFSVTDAQGSLKQAADSALRSTIGKHPMEQIQTDGKVQVNNDTQKELNDIIANYHMGIKILAVNLESVRPPMAVQEAFDDAISAQEDEQNLILQSQSYTNRVVPEAEGNAAELVAKAKSYREKVIKEAEGEVAQFLKLLPEYKAAPDVTRARLYITTMEKIMSQTGKVVVNTNSGNNVLVLPLDKKESRNNSLNQSLTALIAEKANQLEAGDKKAVTVLPQKAIEQKPTSVNNMVSMPQQTVIRQGR